MKNRGSRIAVLIGLVITVTLVGGHYVRLKTKTDIVERNLASVQDAQMKAIGEKVALLEHESAVQSNRADAAEAMCQDEKEANEPLRKQIEKMIGEEIRLAAELDKKRQEIQKPADETAGKTNTDLVDLESRLSDLEDEKARLVENLDELRKELKEKQPKELEKVDSRSDELNKIIEILQEKKQPDDNMDLSTNEAEDADLK